MTPDQSPYVCESNQNIAIAEGTATENQGDGHQKFETCFETSQHTARMERLNPFMSAVTPRCQMFWQRALSGDSASIRSSLQRKTTVSSSDSQSNATS
eukprot:6288325-Amphidinium_carterae.2